MSNSLIAAAATADSTAATTPPAPAPAADSSAAATTTEAPAPAAAAAKSTVQDTPLSKVVNNKCARKFVWLVNCYFVGSLCAKCCTMFLHPFNLQRSLLRRVCIFALIVAMEMSRKV